MSELMEISPQFPFPFAEYVFIWYAFCIILMVVKKSWVFHLRLAIKVFPFLRVTFVFALFPIYDEGGYWYSILLSRFSVFDSITFHYGPNLLPPHAKRGNKKFSFIVLFSIHFLVFYSQLPCRTKGKHMF